MASRDKRGRSIRVRWYDPDGTPRSKTCRSAAAATALERELAICHGLGRRWEPAPIVQLPRLVDLHDAYLRDTLRLGRAPRTIERAHAVLGPFLEWCRGRVDGGVVTVSILTRSLLEAYDAHQVAMGNGISTRRTAMWAVGGCWKWGWQHPEWRGALGEPSIPQMPRVVRTWPKAPSWAQLDAVVGAATTEALRRPEREWARRVVVLLRGLGWRVAQCLQLRWADVDLEANTIRLRPELGKSAAERSGRVVPMPSWLRDEIKAWAPVDELRERRRKLHADELEHDGRLVGPTKHIRKASDVVRGYWEATAAPSELYLGRPDHAFRIGLISGLTRARLDHHAVDYYVGHAAQGVRGHYVDPTSLPLAEVAAGIPPIVLAELAQVIPIRQPARSVRR